MRTTFQLIQIVKDPIDKNCWLSVNDYRELRGQFESFIQDYDFIDFEGEVFYYNVLSKLPINDIKGFLNRTNKSTTLFNNIELDEFLKFLSPETKQIVLTGFVENTAVILINN